MLSKKPLSQPIVSAPIQATALPDKVTLAAFIIFVIVSGGRPLPFDSLI
jgi:hypothetical protein